MLCYAFCLQIYYGQPLSTCEKRQTSWKGRVRKETCSVSLLLCRKSYSGVIRTVWLTLTLKVRNPAGIFYANKGLESGLSVPYVQYFRSHSSPVCHYCNVIHLSLFWFLWYQSSPILGWTKTSTENNIQKIFDPKWTQKYDNVGAFKWSRSGPCPLGMIHLDLYLGSEGRSYSGVILTVWLTLTGMVGEFWVILAWKERHYVWPGHQMHGSFLHMFFADPLTI